MTQKIKKIFYKASAAVLFLPALASAQNCTSDCFGSGLYNASPYFPHTGLGSATSLTGLIMIIIQYLLLFAAGVAIVFVIIGGYQYITSAGNEEAAEKGRKTFTNAIIGVIVIVLSYTIITVIANLVSSGY